MILTTFCLNVCLIMMVENDFSFYQQIHNICVTKQFRLETEKINPDLICQPVSVILLSSPFQWDLEIVFGRQAKVNRTRFNQKYFTLYQIFSWSVVSASSSTVSMSSSSSSLLLLFPSLLLSVDYCSISPRHTLCQYQVSSGHSHHLCDHLDHLDHLDAGSWSSLWWQVSEKRSDSRGAENYSRCS